MRASKCSIRRWSARRLSNGSLPARARARPQAHCQKRRKYPRCYYADRQSSEKRCGFAWLTILRLHPRFPRFWLAQHAATPLGNFSSCDCVLRFPPIGVSGDRYVRAHQKSRSASALGKLAAGGKRQPACSSATCACNRARSMAIRRPLAESTTDPTNRRGGLACGSTIPSGWTNDP
jgi:hypothetical protein